MYDNAITGLPKMRSIVITNNKSGGNARWIWNLELELYVTSCRLITSTNELHIMKDRVLIRGAYCELRYPFWGLYVYNDQSGVIYTCISTMIRVALYIHVYSGVIYTCIYSNEIDVKFWITPRWIVGYNIEDTLI